MAGVGGLNDSPRQPLCVVPPCGLVWASLHHGTWLANPRANAPQEREPDGGCFTFCPSLGSHQTSHPLDAIGGDSHESPIKF